MRLFLKKNIFFFILFSFSWVTATGQNVRDIGKLYHKFGEEFQVVNPEFYIRSKNLKLEEKDLKEKLSNGENSFKYACAFPARYTILRRKYKGIQKYNLSNCIELSKFLKTMNGKFLSIVLTSEFYKAPSSAFGHIMLVIHKNKKIGLLDTAVHYSAETNRKDGFFKYAMKGIGGLYDGYYIAEPFFKKYHEYSNVEQRYLFSNNLIINDEQLVFLKYHLFELNKAKFNYYFLGQNCAYRVDALLAILYNVNVDYGILYTLPQDIFTKYKKYYAGGQKILPYSSLAKSHIESLSVKERQQFRKIIKGRLRIDNMTSDKIKKANFYYSQLLYKRENVYNQNFVENLRRSILGTTSVKKDFVASPLHRVSPRKISFGIQSVENQNWGTFSFRNLLLDHFSFQKGSLYESELSILEADLLIRDSIKLSKFDLVSMKIFPEYDSFFNELSWQFKVGADRDNIRSELRGRTFLGLGHSIKYYVYLNYFFNIGSEVDFKKVRPYLSPEINIFGYLGSRLKFGVSYSYQFFKDSFDSGYKIKSYVTVQVNKDNEFLFLYDIQKRMPSRARFEFRHFF